MSILSNDHAVELCQSLVQQSPADQTEVTLDCVEDRFVRYACDGPTQNADREKYAVAFRVRIPVDGQLREARATCGTIDPDDMRAAMDRALVLAEHADPVDSDRPMGGPVTIPGSAMERPTQDHTFREKGAWIVEAQAAAHRAGLLSAGLVQTTVLSKTLVNSAGRVAHGAQARASFSMTAYEGGGSGVTASSETVHASVDRLDVPSAIRQTVERAAKARHPEPIDPGEYTVVLMPQAVSALLLGMSYAGFGAQEYHESRSPLCGRVGERLFPDGLCLMDDVRHELYPGIPFDGEGSPTLRTDLLRHGAFTGPVTDAHWAARLGLTNTGHGHSQPSPRGPEPRHLVLAPGHQSTEQLIAGVENGLLVSQFHYTNLMEPREMVFTGMTRGGTFRIEGGRVTRPVHNLRFTQSWVQALTRVRGIGNQLHVAGALFGGEVLCPSLRIDGFRFT
ncbi:MAG TPA: TldD/PmbA family protein, partial [Planctomycetota bacterium]|nr:TldD/PmbA family protein [Planctomycetota bacterium]